MTPLDLLAAWHVRRPVTARPLTPAAIAALVAALREAQG